MMFLGMVSAFTIIAYYGDKFVQRIKTEAKVRELRRELYDYEVSD